MIKIIEDIKITGNCKWLEILYEVTDNECEDTDSRAYFKFRGCNYYLDEIMNINNKVHMPFVPEFMKGFDGYTDGVLIKIHDCGDSIQAFNFCRK